MPAPLSAHERRRMRIVSAGMLVGVLVILGVALCARQIMKPAGVPFVSWFAVGFALVSPLLAAAVDRAQPDRSSAAPGAPSAAFARHLVSYATLEAAGLLCGVALLIGSNLLPLAAALVPIGAMVLRFPRASALS
ncbi:MAG: hypothetical protein DMF77_17805 [Acidobacteria bacterium]|nr:MAG: hypothetical protein DMF77_17805 [Acidobacteriota bacterium]